MNVKLHFVIRQLPGACTVYTTFLQLKLFLFRPLLLNVSHDFVSPGKCETCVVIYSPLASLVMSFCSLTGSSTFSIIIITILRLSFFLFCSGAHRRHNEGTCSRQYRRNGQIVRWNVWSGQTDVEEHCMYVGDGLHIIIFIKRHSFSVSYCVFVEWSVLCRLVHVIVGSSLH